MYEDRFCRQSLTFTMTECKTFKNKPFTLLCICTSSVSYQRRGLMFMSITFFIVRNKTLYHLYLCQQKSKHVSQNTLLMSLRHFHTVIYCFLSIAVFKTSTFMPVYNGSQELWCNLTLKKPLQRHLIICHGGLAVAFAPSTSEGAQLENINKVPPVQSSVSLWTAVTYSKCKCEMYLV